MGAIWYWNKGFDVTTKKREEMPDACSMCHGTREGETVCTQPCVSVCECVCVCVCVRACVRARTLLMWTYSLLLAGTVWEPVLREDGLSAG
jgi:hypothetical protein